MMYKKYKNIIKIAHLNIQGIKPKEIELKAYIQE